MLVLDVPAADHAAEAAFWAGATGRPLPPIPRFPEFHGGPLPGDHGLGLLVQRLDGGPARMHLDIHTDDVAAEVARLERLGASRVREVNGWWIMKDPAGLVFCVIPDGSEAVTGDGGQRWD